MISGGSQPSHHKLLFDKKEEGPRMTDVDVKKEGGRINLTRRLVREVGVCDLCGDPEVDSIQENVAVIRLAQRDGVLEELILCNLHEGFLIYKLLKSYLKRIQCGPRAIQKKMGFKGAIPKILFDTEDESILSIQEKMARRKEDLKEVIEAEIVNGGSPQ